MYTLITAAATARAHHLKKLLNNDHIILGDFTDLPEIMLRSNSLIKLPSPRSAAYAHEMLTLCLDRQIEKVYVLQQNEIVALSAAELLFNEYGIELVYDLQ